MKINTDMHFSQPVLTKCEFVANEGYTHMDGIKIEMPVSLSKKYGKIINNRACPILLSVKVGGKNDAFPYFAEVEMGSNFFWDERLDETFRNDILELRAPALLYGYIRPVMAMLTGYSVFSSFNMPFGDFRKDSVENKDEI